jgi:Fe-S oxidoreductase
MAWSGRLADKEAVLIDDAVWNRLSALTGGTAALCYQCGTCTAACPWGLVRPGTMPVRTVMREAQLGLLDGSAALWSCTTCGQCEALCPRGVSIVDVFRGLRQAAWEQRRVPEGLPSLLWSVHWNGNPWAQPPSQRMAWARSLNLPAFDPAQHEILLFIGCTASYDRRAQQIARSLVRVLEAAGVRFGVLGEDEPCCGESVLSVGHGAYFAELAGQGAEAFARRGVGRMVILSPHCYDAFRNHYPAGSAGFEPVHYTGFLAELVETGRLAFSPAADLRITFHDPCYLARHNGDVDTPRQVLAAIPGAELVEMENTRTDTLCCGGGGGRMWMETAAGERFSDVRVGQALATGANILATACPFCVTCLEDSLKARKIHGLAVMDIAEIASRVAG